MPDYGVLMYCFIIAHAHDCAVVSVCSDSLVLLSVVWVAVLGSGYKK